MGTREWLLEVDRPAGPSRLSGARLREELIPLLDGKRPTPAFRLLSQWNALAFLIPNLKMGENRMTFSLAISSRPSPKGIRLSAAADSSSCVAVPESDGLAGASDVSSGHDRKMEQA